MRATYSSKCRVCRKLVQVGDEIRQSHKGPWVHARCYTEGAPEAEEQSPPGVGLFAGTVDAALARLADAPGEAALLAEARPLFRLLDAVGAWRATENDVGLRNACAAVGVGMDLRTESSWVPAASRRPCVITNLLCVLDVDGTRAALEECLAALSEVEASTLWAEAKALDAKRRLGG